MDNKKTYKNIAKFYCEKCDFKCSLKSDMSRHLLRRKHLINMNGSELEVKKHKKTYVCNCGKEYSASSGLWKHQQKCNKHNSNKTGTDENNIINNISSLDNNELTQIVLDIVKSNHDLQKQNMELQKQMIEVCKNAQSNTNINNINQNNINQTNSHNKTFNLQFFLNETCKDAMNISEFIENISLQLSDLENIGKLGYIEGISNIIIKNLKALDVEKRPVHCSDIKREIMYVKDDDKWEKDHDDKQKIKQVISNVVSKNLKLLPAFQEKYPDYLKPDSKKSDEYNQIIMETMGGQPGNGDKNKEKIIRKIAREVVIDKE
jgi:hypothetical protein